MRKRSNNTPAFARADCKAGFPYYINKVLSDSDKLIILKIVTDGVGESGASAIMYRRGVDTSAPELVNESLIVIGLPLRYFRSKLKLIEIYLEVCSLIRIFVPSE